MNYLKSFISYILDIFKLSAVTNRKFIIIILLVFFGSLVEILSLSLIIPFISALFGENNNFFFFKTLKITEEKVFIYLTVILIALIIIRSITIILLNYIQTKYSQNIVIELRSKILNSFLKEEYLNYKNKKISEFVYSLNDLSSRFGSIFMNLIKTISDLIFAIIILIYLSTLEYIFLAMFILIVIIWLTAYDRIFGKLLKNYGKKFNYYIQKIIATGTESFVGFKEIILLNSKDIFKTNLEKASKNLASYQIKHNLIFQIQLQFIEILTGVIILGSVLYLFFSEPSTSLIIGKLSVFAVGIFRLKPIVGTLNKSISDFRFNSDVINILKNNLYINYYNSNFIQKKTDSVSIYKKIDKIQFKNISFSYPKLNNNLILKNINFEISDKEVIGITGKSGEGKTTLLDLISGLIYPNSGKILINNFELNQSDLRDFIGYIPQESFILDSDIKTNIAMENNESKINFNKVKEALTKAGLSNFVNNLDKKVGEMGNLLSGGQRQRLVIARQFYRDNKILIFDESTNALDKKTEDEILNEIINLKEKPIIIIVSHTIDLKKYCDKIYKLENKDLKIIN